jgi:hypothetical protein
MVKSAIVGCVIPNASASPLEKGNAPAYHLHGHKLFLAKAQALPVQSIALKIYLRFVMVKSVPRSGKQPPIAKPIPTPAAKIKPQGNSIDCQLRNFRLTKLAFWTDNKAIVTTQAATIAEISKLVNALIFPMMLRTKSRKEVANIISRRIDRLLNKTSNKLLLRGLGLTSIPEPVKHLSSLPNFQSLNLQDNRIDELPDWIGEFTNLRSLNLRNNNLSQLPESIWQCTKLQMLDLSNNLIFNLSESIG